MTAPEPVPTGPEEPEESRLLRRETKPRPAWMVALRIVGLVVIAAVIVAVLRTKLPSPQALWNALQHANWWWVLATAALQVVSIGMLIRQQRRLLHAFGVPVSATRMGAISYSSTAISLSLPAGGAVGAGYSYREYRRSGASSTTALTVMVLSGAMFTAALAALYLIGLGVAFSTTLQRLGDQHPVTTLSIGIVVVGLILLAILSLARIGVADSKDPTTRPWLSAYEKRHPKIGAAMRHTLNTIWQARRVRLRDWNTVVWTSLGNWVLDAASLWAACQAVGAHVGPIRIGIIYLGVQLVRQIPLTPGGIGVIEAALMAGLVSAGAAQGPAAAAVLIYRLFSAWLLIPVGFTTMAALRRGDAALASNPAPAALPPGVGTGSAALPAVTSPAASSAASPAAPPATGPGPTPVTKHATPPSPDTITG